MNTTPPPSTDPRKERNILAAISIGLFVVVALIGTVIVAQTRSGSNDHESALTDLSSTLDSNSTGDASVTSDSLTEASAPSTSAPSTESETPLSSNPPTTSAPVGGQSTTVPASTTTVAPVGYPVLFSINTYVGHWEGTLFNFGQDGQGAPAGLVGSQVQLVSSSGATYKGRVSNCENEVLLDPIPTDVQSAYWHSEGAPFISTRANDDRSLDAMNAALIVQGIDPTQVGSFGAPLAADGSANRVLWYPKSAVSVGWVATFNPQNNTINTFEGDPVTGADFELSKPDNEMLDLDNDGNLESHIGVGDADNLVEWATESTLWSAGAATCRR